MSDKSFSHEEALAQRFAHQGYLVLPKMAPLAMVEGLRALALEDLQQSILPVEYEAQTQSAVGQPEPSEVLAAALVLKAAKSVADRDSRASRRGSSSGTGSASLSVSSQVAATSGAGTHRTRWGDVPRS